MKRILALCALLLVATPAFASRVLVTVPTTPTASDQAGYAVYMRHITNHLDRMGVNYDIVRGNQLPTAQVAAGLVWFGGYARSYDAVIVCDFTRSTGTYGRVFRPDSLTLIGGNWPTIPVLILGSFRIASGTAEWTQTTTCSTSITGSTGTFGDIGTSNGQERSAYMPNLPWRFKSWDGLYPRPVASGQNGINRSILNFGRSSAWNDATTPKKYRYETCTDCDSVGWQTPSADSSLIWERIHPDTTTVGGVTNFGRLIFAWPTANGSGATANFSHGVLGIAIAHLDSVSGGRVIGSKPGWKPPRMGIFIAHAGYHSAAAKDAGLSDGDHGLFRPDSATAKASIDSLASLRVPLTIGYNADIDTIAAYPEEVYWWKNRLGTSVTGTPVKYSPMIYTGLFASKFGNSTKFRPTDVWGYQRVRALQAGNVPYTPASTDTSLYAQLLWSKARLDTLGLPASSALYPPRWDWVPSQYTRVNLPPLDSLTHMLWRAGYRVLVTSPSNIEQSPSKSYMRDGSSNVYTVTNIRGLFPEQRTVPVFTAADHVTRLGSFTFAASRSSFDGDPASNNLKIENVDGGSGHWHADEFLFGFFSTAGPWYPVDYTYYFHEFHTQLNVLRIEWGLLAGDAAGSNKRLGWWQLKSVVNQVKMINAAAGRKVIDIVECGDL